MKPTARLSSEKVSVGGCSSDNRGPPRQIVNKYPAQKPVTVYFDPSDPAAAILEPGKTGGMFVLLGLLGIFGKPKPA